MKKDLSKILLEKPEDANLLDVNVSQGTIAPTSDFSYGNYGEFWIEVSYKKRVSIRHGSYETSSPDKIVKDMKIMLKKEMEILKESYRSQCKISPIEVDLDSISRKFMGTYRDITAEKGK